MGSGDDDDGKAPLIVPDRGKSLKYMHMLQEKKINMEVDGGGVHGNHDVDHMHVGDDDDDDGDVLLVLDQGEIP